MAAPRRAYAAPCAALHRQPMLFAVRTCVLLLPLLFFTVSSSSSSSFFHFRGSNLKRTFVRSRSDFKLALTEWSNLKNKVSNAVNWVKSNVVNLGKAIYNDDSTQNFINEWVKPAVHDAKQLVSNLFNKAEATIDPVISNLAHDAKESVAKVKDSIAGSGGSGSYAAGSSGPSYSSVVPAAHSGLNYLHADLAAHYGMDSKAAYSEALQNTAYQRAVADLKRAGLNPVLAVNGLSPAGSYAAGNTLAGGSGSGSSGGYRSGNSGRKYAFDSDTYNLIGVAGTVVGAVAGMVSSPKAPVLGASTGAMLGKQLTQSLAQAVTSASRR